MGEVIVVEVIVIVAMPIVAMPSTMATIPGNVTTASGASKAGAAHVASSKAGAAHVASTKAGAAHVASTKVSAAHVAAAEVASSAKMSTTAVAGVRHNGGKKQATRKGSYCGYTHSHDYSPWAHLARYPSADLV